jgi:hypothetical protein
MTIGGLVKLAVLLAAGLSVSGCLHSAGMMNALTFNLLGMLMSSPPSGEYSASSDSAPVTYVTNSAPVTTVTNTTYVTNYYSSSGGSRGSSGGSRSTSSSSHSHRHRH